MRARKSFYSRLFLYIGLTTFVLSACNRNESIAGKKDSADVLAKIDDTVITLSEFQDTINRQSPYVRARYTSLERRKEFLDNLVKFELLAKEAERRNFNKDPEVVRTMKQVMIQKLLQDETGKLRMEDLSDDECKKYYDAHPDEFNKPEEIRVSLILVKDQASVKKVVADPRMKGLDNQAFRALVAQYSIDEATKDRGGDLRYFDAKTKDIPADIVAEAFKLQKIGDTSAPVKTKLGYVILKLTGQRKAVSRPFDEVKPVIRSTLFTKKKQEAMEAFVKSLREKTKVTIDEAKLGSVKIEATNGGFPGPGLPPPAPGTFHQGAPGAPVSTPATPGNPGVSNINLPPAGGPVAPAPNQVPTTAPNGEAP